MSSRLKQAVRLLFLFMVLLVFGGAVTVFADSDSYGGSTVSDAVTYTPDYKPGSSPTVISAEADGNTVTLKWSGSAYPVTITKVSGGAADALPSKLSGDTSYKVTGLDYGKTYTFTICYENKFGKGAAVNFPSVTTPAKAEAGTVSKLSSDAFGTSMITITSTVPGKAAITYRRSAGDGAAVYYIQVQKEGKNVLKDTIPWYDSTKNVKITYGKTTKFQYRIYQKSGSQTSYTKWKTVKVKCAKLKKPSITVTTISSNKAGVRWGKVPGATSYKVYCGNKLIKTLSAKKTSYIYSKAGAGYKKYKVVPYIKTIGMSKAKAGPASAAKKGSANQRSYKVSTNVKSTKYGKAPYRIRQISLSGNTYTVSGLVVNNRIFTMLRYQKLKITIYCDGKKVASQTFKNLNVNCPAGSVKQLTVRIQGKGGVDFRNAAGVTYRASWTPYWSTVGASSF